MERRSGILMPIFSLPSPYGIGTLGKAAYEYVDFLHDAGQTWWQILPVCPTGYGESPYQTCSTFAGNPYFIDLDMLREDGLLELSDYNEIDWGENPARISYRRIEKNRLPVLHKAYENWIVDHKADLEKFFKDNKWLRGYALFMALKEEHNGKPWWEWEESYRARSKAALAAFEEANRDTIAFWGFLQYEFFRQWEALKKYRYEKEVYIIGDIPIYVAHDSADVWQNPDEFWLDEDLNPVRVAGCPPDSFSKDGQLWGNPLYRWDKMKADGYRWWIERFRAAMDMYDMVRIDHFRGFESYYTIEYGAKTAAKGEWLPGPGMSLFNALKKELGELNVIAEDLGVITPEVEKLVKDTGFPGMKVLEFAFDAREQSNYLPHTYTKNSVTYIGTHDNDTTVGWYDTMKKTSPGDALYCKNYLRLNTKEGYTWGIIKGAMATVSDLTIIQMQDYLDLGYEARINTPSTVGKNWKWRMMPKATTRELAETIYDVTELYSRLPALKQLEDEDDD